MVAKIIDTCEPGGELTEMDRVAIRLNAARVVHDYRRLSPTELI